MQVGTDTYVTVAEADTYVSTHYRSTSAARTRWAALSENDKAILLVDACSEMEQLPFHGRKAEDGQLLAFPRRLPWQDYTSEVPEAVKSAQVELAVWLSDDVKQSEAEQRRALQGQGVKSFSVGDLSETYNGTSTGARSLLCPKAKLLLSPYLTGAYAVR